MLMEVVANDSCKWSFDCYESQFRHLSFASPMGWGRGGGGEGKENLGNRWRNWGFHGLYLFGTVGRKQAGA